MDINESQFSSQSCGDYRNFEIYFTDLNNPSLMATQTSSLLVYISLSSLILKIISPENESDNKFFLKEQSLSRNPITFNVELRQLKNLVVWEYTNDSIFSKILIGIVRLKTLYLILLELIWLWEITPNKEVLEKIRPTVLQYCLKKIFGAHINMKKCRF